MKNLLNCHTYGVHSFPFHYDAELGTYKRIFFADVCHNLVGERTIAIHAHHVDIKITVLKGMLFNQIYNKPDNDFKGEVYNFKTFKWNSHILNGNGGFDRIGNEQLMIESCKAYDYENDPFYLTSDQLHTVFCLSDKRTVWLVEEFPATKGYDSTVYTTQDLTSWTPKGLYIEVDNQVRDYFLSDCPSAMQLIDIYGN